MAAMLASTPPRPSFDPFLDPQDPHRRSTLDNTAARASSSSHFVRRPPTSQFADVSQPARARPTTWYGGGSPSAGPSSLAQPSQPRHRSEPDDDLIMADVSPSKPLVDARPLAFDGRPPPARLPSLAAAQRPPLAATGASVFDQPSSTVFLSTSKRQHHREQTAPEPVPLAYGDSPIKQRPAPMLSHSRSLGRQPGGKAAKRPQALFTASGTNDKMRNSRSLAFGEDLTRMAGSVFDDGDGLGPDSDDDFTASSSLKPLSFPSLSSVARPPSSSVRQRALTEADHNNGRPPPPAFDLQMLERHADSHFLAYSMPPTGPSDSPAAPPTPAPTRTVRLNALPPDSHPHLSVHGTSSQHGFLGAKKTVSLDNLNLRENSAPTSFPAGGGAKVLGRVRRGSLLSSSAGPVVKGHRRGGSSGGPVAISDAASPFNVGGGPTHISRSTGLKSGLAHNLPIQHSLSAGSLAASASAQSSASRADSILNRSAPASLSNRPGDQDLLPFNDAKPLQAAFLAKSTLTRKFKPRDSGVALDADATMTDLSSIVAGMESPASSSLGSSTSSTRSVRKNSIPQINIPSTLSQTYTAFDPPDDDLVTPGVNGPDRASGWPSAMTGGSGIGGGPSMAAGAFDFLGADAADALASAVALQGTSGSKIMPDTPVKKGSFGVGAGKKAAPGGSAIIGGAFHKPPPKPLLSFAHSIRGEVDSGSSSSPHHPPAQSSSTIVRSPAPHHSTSVLSMSHRPSQARPPHLQIASSSRSLIPVPTVSPRLKPATAFQMRITSSSPDSHQASSSPPRAEAESPTMLRKGKLPSPIAMQVSSPTGSGCAELANSNGVPGTARGMSRTESGRMSFLRRTSSGFGSMSGSESEGGVELTPTRRGFEKAAARQLVSPSGAGSPSFSHRQRLPSSNITSSLALSLQTTAVSGGSTSQSSSSNPSSPILQSRLSLPNIPAAPHPRRLQHRSSQGARRNESKEDIFETKFVVVELLGKGAFSQVWKVQERGRSEGEGVWAVKRTKGVFEGVKDRLRHLEEVDILRALSTPGPNPHVVEFVDAWEQNRQLFIQTELCELGNLAFFLEEYGRVVERMDEARVWKIVRELSDGLRHIHSSDIIHLDLKPANILITAQGALKIGDFGLSSRFPRVDPATILRGAGLGGEAVPGSSSDKGWEREGDRDYMALETLNGVFGKPADIFSFGLLILETATNIIVPAGDEPWHALRSNDFSDVDLSPLSPALTELITLCMRADPAERPTIDNVVGHIVVNRARKGKEALHPEPEHFIVELLTGSLEGIASPPTATTTDEDVEMLED